jgi:hydroxyacylglutathione hydrolase
MRVVPVPCLQDNYAYLVVCERTKKAAIVDPGEAQPVLAAVAREGVTLDAVWATHHHGDHVGGVPALVEAVPGLRVVASSGDRSKVPKVTDVVDDADETAVGDVKARVIHNPGHTLGAISFWIEDGAAVFTGDTLFGAGCGRLFEGTPAQMYTSLSRLTSLPPETRVYFGHEYTEANLRFAAAVEPDSPDIAARTAAVQKARASHEPTTPSTVADERATNPFARCSDPAVRAAARAAEPGVDDSDPAAVLGAIRRWKDRFR